MKQFIFIVILLVATTAASGQARGNRFSYTTTIGTGIAINEPSYTPFHWQLSAHYNLNSRFAIGIGTGVSVYEKPLIPLYGSIQCNLTRPRKLTPYIECNVGGALATDKEANGGFYLSPSLGTRLQLSRKMKLNFAVGYESQKLEQVKKHSGKHFTAEFKEALHHHSFTFKIGITL